MSEEDCRNCDVFLCDEDPEGCKGCPFEEKRKQLLEVKKGE